VNGIQRANAGFTLVEMLVSLALLAVMTVYALSALFSLRVFNRVAERVSIQSEVDASARHLREAIGGMRPVFAMGQDNEPALVFHGRSNSIEFVSASNGTRETGGLYQTRYRVDSNGALISERTIFRDGPVGAPNVVKLIGGVIGMDIKYHGKPHDSAVDDWTPKDTLPNAVEIMLKFKSEDDRDWTPLIVPVWTAY
jgi:general secretion pathway protein J